MIPAFSTTSLRSLAINRARRLIGVRLITNYYNLFPETLPKGAPPDGPFDIDAKALRHEYLRAQQRAHPDVAGAGSQVDSAQLSTAYRALLNPLTRAEHILSLRSGNPLDEGATLQDEDLLMEIMMARERVSEAESPEELAAIISDNNERWSQSEEHVATALEKGDYEAAKIAVIELSYWFKLKKAIEERLEELSNAQSPIDK